MIKTKLLFFYCLLFTTYCYSQSIWIQKANFPAPTARGGSVGFSIGTKGYIGTGGDLGVDPYKKDFWEYDPVTNIWSQKADFGGQGRYSAVGFSIGNKGYIGTGTTAYSYSGPICMKDFWEYDPVTNTWIQKADFGGDPRYGVNGFSIGSKGYIGIGLDADFLLKDFWEYDQLTDTWTKKTDFGGPLRSEAVGFSIGNKGYIGTGSKAWGINDFWEWNQTTDTWAKKSDFPGSARAGAVGFSIGTKGYIGIGSDASGNSGYYPQDFWEYNQTTDTWTQVTDFGGTGRGGAVGFSIGNKGYVGTAKAGNDFWEFNPHAIPAEIDEDGNTIRFSVFPNPARRILTVNFTSILKSELFISVKNELGQIIYSEIKKEFSDSYYSTIDLGKQPQGVYYIEVIQEENCKTQKIIIE